MTSWLRAAVREKVADSTVGEPEVEESDEDSYEMPEHAQAEAADHSVVQDAVPVESKAEIAPPLEETSKKVR